MAKKLSGGGTSNPRLSQGTRPTDRKGGIRPDPNSSTNIQPTALRKGPKITKP